MLSGFSFYLNPEEIGIIGSKKDPRTQGMLREIYLAYLPNKILSLMDHRESTAENWFPFLKDKGTLKVSTVFICKGYTCLPPVENEEELKKILS